MKRFDKIKSMTLDQLAHYLCEAEYDCEGCMATDMCSLGSTGFKNWLEEDDSQEQVENRENGVFDEIISRLKGIGGFD